MARLDWYIRANLKLRHLQLVVALDEHRNLGKVAALLNVTQPALSKTLGELQQGLGVQLFERTGRGLRPTEYGDLLIRHARGLLQGLADAGDALHEMSAGATRSIRIGVQPAWASWLLPKALVDLKKQSPKASVYIREGTMDILLSELRLGNLDVLLGNLPAPSNAKGLKEHILFDDTNVLVVRAEHPLAKETKPSWETIASYPWVLPPSDTLLRQPLLVTFYTSGVTPPSSRIETLSFSIIRQYLQDTDAIASMPSKVAMHFCQKNELVQLPVTVSKLMRPVGLLWRNDYPIESLAPIKTSLEHIVQVHFSEV